MKRFPGLLLVALSLSMQIPFECIAQSNEERLERSRAERIAKLVQIEKNAYSFASTYGTAISAPVGRLLLMRKAEDICAIRITEFHRGGDAKPQTSFRTDEETLYTEYDWFYLRGNSGYISKTNSEFGHSQLIYKPVVGYGHLHIQRGRTTVKCGPLKVSWSYPNSISLIKPNGRFESNGIELSPTQWENFKDVDFSDPRLTWYGYDDNRKLTYIPLEKLPGKSAPE